MVSLVRRKRPHWKIADTLFEGDVWENISEVNQNYNKILERDWLSAARFEH